MNNEGVNPVDKFEEAFMNCLCALTKEDTLTNVDRDEIRVDVEQGMQNVIESARSMESYFLKKRLEIAAHKPELLVKDDANELRLELIRKDELLKKNYEKISHWQSILSDVQAATAGKQTGSTGQHVSASGLNQQLQSPRTPQQGPMTPTGGRPNTPGGSAVGRPQTPGTGVRMQTSTNVGFPSSIPQLGSPQIGNSIGATSGLQGPLAYLEKTASGAKERGRKENTDIKGTDKTKTDSSGSSNKKRKRSSSDAKKSRKTTEEKVQPKPKPTESKSQEPKAKNVKLSKNNKK